MAVQEQLLTVEEFWAEYAGKPFELVHGRIVEVMPAGGTHGGTTRRTGARVGDFVDANDLGEVFGAETGFQLAPDVMRGADVAFVRRDKWAAVENQEKYVPFAPDLAVEVVSPNDGALEVLNKVEEYLAAGTLLVWVMYPDTRKVVVHYPDHTARTFGAGEMLDGGDVLPGLKLAVADLFPPLS